MKLIRCQPSSGSGRLIKAWQLARCQGERIAQATTAVEEEVRRGMELELDVLRLRISVKRAEVELSRRQEAVLEAAQDLPSTSSVSL